MTSKFPKVVGYELVQQIGGGGFSTVYRAVNFEDHRVAACKLVLLTPSTSEKERKNIEKEMRVHAALKHANVLEFLNAVVVEQKHRDVYVPGIYMLLELAAGGDLFDKIAPDVGVGDQVAHYYFNQLLAGMEYIHSQGVCHRDLKPENLLLDVAGTLKISDFGLSAVYKLKESGKTRTLTERCGSLPYVAPELNSDAPYLAEPVDVWGVGVILFTLLAGNTPWDEPTIHSPEFVRYVSGAIFRELPWCRLGEEALSLLRSLLAVDPSRRINLAEAASHSWCLRPSQLANKGPLALADKLTESLRDNGDLGLAAPDFGRRFYFLPTFGFFFFRRCLVAFNSGLSFFCFLLQPCFLRTSRRRSSFRCVSSPPFGLSIYSLFFGRLSSFRRLSALDLLPSFCCRRLSSARHLPTSRLFEASLLFGRFLSFPF
ncbi:uncharacterized protein LACBIDRAFT_304059 [Laccaria bicolor S238N-H82]|uniref:non-specific serine/threonine protein kinase n=1 Tax=Laccaria bicolor (strain S238N-H82 / ATCC MYA-4686) TaxID=486041 RepID=B0DKV4_LACBS|nr:uncharacterized protein LACBIDRAFT_304059 [Laccaria bicolor S238N-H82]EDR04712.1 predicted protein [Laccaria bicolor S238N-H82]|eukprot:XP_001884536.1 predicted protein [Laccaria bicolor S238N-H82]